MGAEDDVSEIDELPPLDRVRRIVEMAEGPITLTGILARPGIYGSLNAQDVMAHLKTLVTERAVIRDDIEGQRSTYRVNPDPEGRTTVIPARPRNHGVKLSGRVRELLERGDGLSIVELCDELGENQSAVEAALHGLKLNGDVRSDQRKPCRYYLAASRAGRSQPERVPKGTRLAAIRRRLAEGWPLTARRIAELVGITEQQARVTVTRLVQLGEARKLEGPYPAQYEAKTPGAAAGSGPLRPTYAAPPPPPPTRSDHWDETLADLESRRDAARKTADELDRLIAGLREARAL